MKQRIFALLLVLLMLAASLVACNPSSGTEGTGSTTAATTPTTAPLGPMVDYVSQVKLDLTSTATAKMEATVKLFVDGDTTHFNVPVSDDFPLGVLKARYLAINTPESTGAIEEYGKQASNFTRSKLESAASIIIESDDENWNVDSTSSRRALVWIWYKPEGSDTYRNLNIEILQEGLALASSTANNRYGTIAMAALNQAKAHKLKIYSGEKDPLFYYGGAQELTLKYLRTHIADYNGTKVSFDGIVTANSDNSVYVEEYDEATGRCYGITIYYGFSLSGYGMDIIRPGNRVHIVGTVQYWEAGGTYQISGLKYNVMKPEDPDNIQKIGEGYSARFDALDVTEFNKQDNVELVFEAEEEGQEDEHLTFDLAYLLQGTSVSIENLKVTKIYTTANGGDNDGAMTLTCTTQDGQTIQLRTTVLKKDGKLLTKDDFLNKTISVKGFVEYYLPEGATQGRYQIKIVSSNYITVVG